MHFGLRTSDAQVFARRSRYHQLLSYSVSCLHERIAGGSGLPSPSFGVVGCVLEGDRLRAQKKRVFRVGSVLAAQLATAATVVPGGVLSTRSWDRVHGQDDPIGRCSRNGSQTVARTESSDAQGRRGS